MEECYKALSDQLDWTNPEGDRCPYDLGKPLPLKGLPCHLTVPAEHFFNNNLEYLKSKNLERKYTTSIINTKAARYELVGIKDMVPKQWSAVKVGDNKDVKRLMRADELYKFSDIMLKFVRDTLHHRLLNFRLGYNKDMPRRKWTDTDQTVRHHGESD
ncbi:hypothetical protein Tco_1254748 [Tanacetum coccineum]